MTRWSLFAVALVACVRRNPPEPVGADYQTGGLEHRMANCPSTLPSARTVIQDLPDGVALTITVAPAELKDLIALAEVHARIGEPHEQPLEHSGMHGGPGDVGHCPLIHNGTSVRFSKLADGVRFEVHALPGRDLAALQRDTRSRLDRLPRFADRAAP